MRRLEAEGLIDTDPSIALTAKESACPAGSSSSPACRAFSHRCVGSHGQNRTMKQGVKEHVMSESVEAATNHLLDSPTTCPHSNPIPGSGYEAPDATALIDHAVGDDFTIIRIPEETEFEDGTLEFLEGLGSPQADMALCSQRLMMVASLLTSMEPPLK